jgi:hypothetical protein
VLHKLGGIKLGAETFMQPFTHVGIYFARHGQLITWKMSDLFPSSGFDKFERRFVEEIPHWKRSLEAVR